MQECGLESTDLLKVDIEGAEKQVFDGVKAWLNVVKMIIIELHGSYPLADFEKEVSKSGFRVLPPNSEYRNKMVMALSPTAISKEF